MKTINVALIGSDYAGVLYANSYTKVSKVPVKIRLEKQKMKSL